MTARSISPRSSAGARGIRDAVPALLAAVTFGIAAPASKHVFVGVGPWLSSGWMYSAAGVGLAVGLTPPIRAFLGRLVRRPVGPTAPRLDPAPSRTTVVVGRWALGVAALLSAVLAPYALLRGVAELSATVSSLLLNLEVTLTPLIAVVVFRERLSLSRWAGAALVVLGGVGCALAANVGCDGTGAGCIDATGMPTAGALWIALACLAWAVDSNLMRLLVHRAPFAVARDKALIGGAISLGIAAAVGQFTPLPAAGTLAAGAAVGLVSFGISVALYLQSLRRLETATTAALFGTAPFVGALVSCVALGERPSLSVLAAGAVMAVGAFLLARAQRADG
jgi:drug/metabolite transporter (DMT)-like permease